eukprot:m.408237 g.408237  ORF g.408237 m.408237 type:complete len:476 (-) comp56507_c0_seq2:1621-3048(-)
MSYPHVVFAERERAVSAGSHASMLFSTETHATLLQRESARAWHVGGQQLFVPTFPVPHPVSATDLQLHALVDDPPSIPAQLKNLDSLVDTAYFPKKLLARVLQTESVKERFNRPPKFNKIASLKSSQDSSIVILFPADSNQTSLTWGVTKPWNSRKLQVSSQKVRFRSPIQAIDVVPESFFRDPMVLVTERNRLTFGSFDRQGEEDKWPGFCERVSIQVPRRVLLSTPNHLLNFEVALSTSHGSLLRWTESGLEEIMTRERALEISGTDTWQALDYGSHPQQILAWSPSGVVSIDLRAPRFEARMINVSLESEGSPTYRVIRAVKNPARPFQHIVAGPETISVFDLRYAAKPLLNWLHCSDQPPDFLHVEAAPENVTVINVVSPTGSSMLYQYHPHTRAGIAKTLPPIACAIPQLSSESINSLLELPRRAALYTQAELHGSACVLVPSYSKLLQVRFAAHDVSRLEPLLSKSTSR